MKKKKSQKSRSRTDETTQEALNAYQKGDFTGAKRILERAIDSQEETSFALGFLATVEKALGNINRAYILFEKSISIEQNNPDILNNYSGLLENKDPAKAVRISNRAVEIAPENSHYHERNGYLKWKKGELEKALEATIKSIKIKPDSPTALINLGGIYKDLGNLDQALASTLKSLELKPDNHTAQMNMGSIYKDLGDLDQALTSTLKSLELKPDNPDAYMNLGSIYKDLGDLDQALTSTLKSLELKPDNPDAYMNLGSIYKDLGDLDQALTSTLKSLELKPDNPDAYMNLGSIYKDLGDLDQALTSTLKSLELKPDNPDAYMNLGWMHEIKCDKEQALNYYLLSTESSCRGEEWGSISSMSYLLILIQLGRVKEAREKIKLNPNPKSEASENFANYNDYLKALLPEIPESTKACHPETIHIGDSQSLAFTNQKISINTIDSVIKPSLVKGGKAWHLGNRQSNDYKACFLNTSRASLSNYKFILLSFGEIDCLPNDGILKHCDKHNAPIEETSKLTAKRYVRWVVNELQEYREKLIFFGTPAPQKEERNEGIDGAAKNCKHLLVRYNFNKALAKECLEFRVKFADVFSLTADEHGFNNKKWLIDDFHLKPNAIQEIIANYLIENSGQTKASKDGSPKQQESSVQRRH